MRGCASRGRSTSCSRDGLSVGSQAHARWWRFRSSSSDFGAIELAPLSCVVCLRFLMRSGAAAHVPAIGTRMSVRPTLGMVSGGAALKACRERKSVRRRHGDLIAKSPGRTEGLYVCDLCWKALRKVETPASITLRASSSLGRSRPRATRIGKSHNTRLRN